MPVRIASISAADPTDWANAWASCRWATYFQSPRWARAWCDASRGALRPAAKLVCFDDGRRAVMPASERSRPWPLPPLRLCSPAGTYGGWLSADELTRSHAAALARWLVDQRGDLRWRTNPYDPHADVARELATESETTQMLELAGGPEAVRSRWSKGHRAAEGQARRAGVVTRKANTERDWRSYFAVYEASIERWGDRITSRYDWPLFDALRRDPDHVALWLAELADRTLAGALVVYARTTAIYWHGAAREEGLRLRAPNLAVATAIDEACQRGATWFDFNPSGGLAGVAAFKRSFGATEHPCPMVVRDTLPIRLLRAGRRAWTELRSRS